MKRRTIITILCTLLTVSASSQGLNTILGGNSDNTNNTTETTKARAGNADAHNNASTRNSGDNININVDTRHFPNVSRYEHALYQNVTKQNGFWKGIGRPLTAADASHLRRHYRLSRPVGQGKYAYMQAMDANGNLTTNHSIGTYLGNSSDNDINYTWVWKLEDVCQWEVMFTDNGATQENAYDKDGNLVYQYYPVAIGPRKIYGHFSDAYGNVVNFRDSENPVKGVYIEQDRQGYDSIIALTDANRNFVRNNDGAFITRQLFDRQGNIIQNMSCNPFGVPMIDDWGNCGWTATYDNRGNLITTTYIDTEGNPMRMPEKKAEADPVITKKYTYDRYGRAIECRYYNQDMQPDTIASGMHLWRATYDTRGHIISSINYRIDGITLANDASGWAKWEYQYDDQGNLLSEVMRDADGNYVNLLSGSDCIHINRYQGNKRVLREEYNTTNGNDTRLNYRAVYSSQADTIWTFINDIIQVDKYDSRHRKVAEEYYNLDMQPTSYYAGDWHRWETTYVGDATHSKITTVYYMPDGTEQERTDYGTPFTRYVVEVDSINHTKTYSYYHGNRLVKREGAEFNPTFSYTTALISYDAVGMPARSNITTFGNTGLFYRVVPLRNNEGDAIAWRCENEFGEPAYIQFQDWDNATRWVSRTGDFLLDEHNDSIATGHDPWDQTPKAFCIEVLDSMALSLGLRSGDILMRYGDWHYSQPDSIYHRYYENTLIYETVDKAWDNKPVVVMRHNPADGTSNLISLTLPQGTPRQLGFQYHIIYMTERETQRYNHTVKRYAMSNELSRVNTSPQGEDKVWFFVPYKVGNASSVAGYTNGLNENAVILAMVAYIDGRSYPVTYDNQFLDLDKAASQDNDSTMICYTTDGQNIKTFMMTESPHLYGRRSYTTTLPQNEALHHLADSLMSILPPMLRDSTMRTPEEAMDAIYYLTPGQQNTVEGKAGWLKYIYDTGLQPPRGIDSRKHVWIEADESSISDLIATEDMLLHIDWTGYTCIPDSTNEYSFYLTNDTIATEMYKLSYNNIEHFTGQLEVPLRLMVVEANEEGAMHDNGCQGEYVLIGWDNWAFGADYMKFAYEYAFNNSDMVHNFTLAPLISTANSYRLGKNITINTAEGLGGHASFKLVDYNTFREVTKRGTKLLKAKKR